MMGPWGAVGPAPWPIVLAAVLLGAGVVMGVRLLPRVWAGEVELADVPPEGWFLPVSWWPRLARGWVASLPVAGLGSLTVIVSRFDGELASAMIVAVLVCAAGWLLVVLTGWPRAVVPPAWRRSKSATSSPK